MRATSQQIDLSGERAGPKKGGRNRPPFAFPCSAALHLVASLLLSCGLPSHRAGAELLIAVAGPTAGTGASATAAVREAAEAAVSRLEAAGGLAGDHLRIVAEDDACSAAGGEAAARRIAALKPALVLGHPCASAAIAAAKVYAAADVPFIATATRHPALTQRRAGPTIFRLDGRDDRQGAFAGQTIARLYPGQRVALVSDRTTYARRIVTDVRAALLAASAREPAMLTLVAGEKDYGRLVAAIAASGARVVLFAGFAIESGIVLRQMRTAGLDIPFIGSDATATPEIRDSAGDALAGMRFVVRAEADVAPSGAEAGNASAGDSSGNSSGDGENTLRRRTETAVLAWADAVRRAGSTAGRPVATALSTAAEGNVAFEANGDAKIASFRLIGPDDIPTGH